MPLGLHNKEAYINEGKRLGVFSEDNSKKLAIIMGKCRSWERDYYGFKNAFPDVQTDLFALNSAVTYVEEVVHWCSRHPMCIRNKRYCNNTMNLYDIRKSKGWENNFKVHSPLFPHEKHLHNKAHWKTHIDYFWQMQIVMGGSALFTAGIVIAMGYTGIVFCGIELTKEYRKYINHFKIFNRVFKNYAKTNNVLLNKKLGYPSWLKESWVREKVK